MAEEAFALSPLSASAASPTDADYHAIREAFMETARGRWFLTEYAKRNRNADTAMVLEAVARIEQSIGAAQTEAAAPAPEVLSEAALAALESARTAIRAEFSETGFDHTLMPWRKSARIIREITWGLRESGADPRICNILDGQARAIEAACDEFPLATIRDRLLSSLDAILPQDPEAAPAMAESTSDEPVAAEITADATPAPVQAAETQPDAVVAEAAVVEAFVVEAAVVEAPVAEAPLVEAAVAEAVTAKIEAAMDIIAPVTPETPTPETPAPEAASLEDVASVVEAPQEAAAEAPPAPVAAVPRSIMTASASQPAPQPMAELTPAEPPTTAKAVSPPHIEPANEPVAEAESAAPAAAETGGTDDLWADIESEIAPLPPFDPAHEASLGASLIEQGVVARPANGRADLLAPIRRMSHAERIAFFS